MMISKPRFESPGFSAGFPRPHLRLHVLQGTHLAKTCPEYTAFVRTHAKRQRTAPEIQEFSRSRFGRVISWGSMEVVSSRWTSSRTDTNYWPVMPWNKKNKVSRHLWVQQKNQQAIQVSTSKKRKPSGKIMFWVHKNTSRSTSWTNTPEFERLFLFLPFYLSSTPPLAPSWRR